MQFRGSDDIAANFAAIMRGIDWARREGARFLMTQECALTGYPPIETKELSGIDWTLLDEKLALLRQAAKENDMFLAVGTVLKTAGVVTNSVVMISASGDFMDPYHKRALWGWDVDNFQPGTKPGIYQIDGVMIGIRICYDFRFPELFRELLRARVNMVFIAFCDNKDKPNDSRYELIKYTSIIRAVENVTYVITANTLSGFQTGPTMIVNPDGKVLQIAPRDTECVLVQDIGPVEESFGQKGILANNNRFLGW